MTRASFIAISAIIAIAITLTGCTNATSPTPTPSATATEKTPGITDIIDTPGSGEGLEGALSDSEVTTCELDSGSWKVEGTLTNSTAVAVNYRLYVSLLASDGDTRALTQVNVGSVEPAQSSSWNISIAANDENLSCVLRVERYPADAPATEPPVDDSGTNG